MIALASAFAMALAFPKTNAIVLAPLGVAGLFWSWYGLSPARAFWLGWLAGTLYFSITYSWFGETAGAFIAPFGFLLTLGPAIGDAFFNFALCGALVAFANARAPRTLAPLAGAAAFAFLEWLRSEGLGPIGVPFGSLAYTQVAGPLGPIAAFTGSFGVTFAICVVGAYLGVFLRERRVRPQRRATWIAYGAVVAVAIAAQIASPARTLAPATYPVAAVQGDIPQSLKKITFDLALRRYTDDTLAVAKTHPKIVVWPETVILAALDRTPWLQRRFSNLAKTIHAELVVGTLDVEPDETEYNVLYFYRADGTLQSVYRKRLLVPFAERIPFAPLFAWIPWTKIASNFGVGDRDGIVDVGGTTFGPVICWESAFADLAATDARHGANALVISTDDAWFGTTAGPYQHAQIAQMRAIETGRWIVRAASTGISGIVSPDGRYVERTALDEEATVSGNIGRPVNTLFDALGSAPFVAAFAALYLGIVIYGRRRSGAK